MFFEKHKFSLELRKNTTFLNSWDSSETSFFNIPKESETNTQFTYYLGFSSDFNFAAWHNAGFMRGVHEGEEEVGLYYFRKP